MSGDIPTARSPRTSLGVLAEAARILLRRWPVLLVIYLLGAGLREAAITLAVLASGVSGLLGNLALALAPPAILAALILMLRATLPTEGEQADSEQPSGAAESGEPETEATKAAQRWRRVMQARSRLQSRAALVGASIVPFLAVYQSQGFLRQDQLRFWNEATYAEAMWGDVWSGGEYDADRIFLTSDPLWGLAIVAIAFGLRQLMSRLGLAKRSTGWSFLAAYLEVAWVAAVVGLLTEALNGVREWVDTRTLVVGARSLWEQALAAAGPVGDVLGEAWSWTWTLVGNLGTVVVVPVAWLTVGAVVLDRTLPKTTVSLPRPIAQLPRGLRPVASRLWNDLRSRFGGIIDGLRMLSKAGLVPMLTSCLALLVIDRLRPLVVLGLRELIGPVRPGTTPVLSVYLDIASYAVFFVAMVCLVSAATARLVAAAEEREEEEAQQREVDAAHEDAADEDAARDAAAPAAGAGSVPGDLGEAGNATPPPDTDRLG